MRVAIIPARGGSVRVPGKNIRMFHGKPIIAYSIEAAYSFSVGEFKFDKVVVSTDDDRIASIAARHNADVFRRPRTDDGHRGTQEVAREVLLQEAIKHNVNGYACVIYATAPMISQGDLEEGYLAVLRGQDFAFGVGVAPLRDAGQFYWGHVRSFLLQMPLISPTTALIPVSESRVCDINEEQDWKRAEEMYAALAGR